MHIIYLMECTLCEKQYIGKAVTSFKIILNKYRKDVEKPDGILACRRVQE